MSERVYIYAADIYCEDCGKRTREELTAQGKAPANPEDDSSYDSNDFPDGPYFNGGGEADTPQHCAECHKFLENPLTEDGYDYVFEALHRFSETGKGNAEVLQEWRDFYREGLELLAAKHKRESARQTRTTKDARQGARCLRYARSAKLRPRR